MGVRVSVPGSCLLGAGRGWFIGVAGSSVMTRGLHVTLCKVRGRSVEPNPGRGTLRARGLQSCPRQGVAQGGVEAGSVSFSPDPLVRHSPPLEPGGAPAVPGPLKAEASSSPFSNLFSAPRKGMWVGVVLSTATFRNGNGSGLEDGVPPGPGEGGGDAAAAAGRAAREGLRPLQPLEPARRGTSSGALACPRVAKVQACKVRIGPARREKRPGPPSPYGRGADWRGRGVGTALSPARGGPAPGTLPRPFPGRSRSPAPS